MVTTDGRLVAEQGHNATFIILMEEVGVVLGLCGHNSLLPGREKRKMMYPPRCLYQSQWSEDRRDKRRLGHLGTLFPPSLGTDLGCRRPTWLRADADLDMFFESPL